MQHRKDDFTKRFIINSDELFGKKKYFKEIISFKNIQIKTDSLTEI